MLRDRSVILLTVFPFNSISPYTFLHHCGLVDCNLNHYTRLKSDWMQEVLFFLFFFKLLLDFFSTWMRMHRCWKVKNIEIWRKKKGKFQLNFYFPKRNVLPEPKQWQGRHWHKRCKPGLYSSTVLFSVGSDHKQHLSQSQSSTIAKQVLNIYGEAEAWRCSW